MQDFEEYMRPEDTDKWNNDPYYAGWFWSNEENDFFRWPTFVAKSRMYDLKATVTSTTYDRSLV